MMSIRTRLALGAILTLMVSASVTVIVGVWLFEKSVTEQALGKTQHDLRSARLIYDAALDELGNKVRLSAFNGNLRASLATGQMDRVAPELEEMRLREGLDVLNVLDMNGRVMLRAQRPSDRGDDLRGDPVVRRVLSEGNLVTATVVVPATALGREDPRLRENARISVDETGAALEDGLVMQAAALVIDQEGQRVGLLWGWKLLNHDVAIVDRIKSTLYHGEVYRGREVGEGTLCLGDVRVATNAVLGEQRAVGSRVDPAVKEVVLGGGATRVDRADVVGEQHLTAYEPIKDVEGKVIGILCLGIPEARYTDVGRQALYIFLVMSVAVVFFAVLAAGAVARGVTVPIGQLVATARALANGDMEARWRGGSQVTEVGLLGTHLNEMADAIRDRDAQLRHRTQEQIGRAERLAMIGRLAAGVAHEINNPLGGIMLFSNLLLRKAPEGPQRENLTRICEETKRCQRIVAGLLDFARHREPKVEPLMLRDVLEKTLDLVRQQAAFLNIEVQTDYQDDDPVSADASQLQQVFMNVVMNAAEAMAGHGKLQIRTRPADGGGAMQATMQDTGCGMSEEQLDRLFEPFFTTKEVGHGTGLGMSISRGIVESHGGTIWAVSELGKGTQVHVSIPVANKTEEA